MKFLVPSLVLVLIFCNVSAQRFSLPQPPANGMQKILVEVNSKTGAKDTIRQGDFIKLWFRSDRKRQMEQPLVRTDFNRHTYYVESALIAITDSELVFMKRPPFMPIPIPIPLPSVDFDTVSIRNITSFRSLNRSVDGAVKGAVMMPTMSFMPEYFTTFPGMLFMMPSMQIGTTFFGDAVFRFHKMNRHNSKYSLTIGEMPADTMYYIRRRKMMSESDYEWEIERFERYTKMYTKIRRDLSDQLLDEFLGNRITSITLGGTFIPGYSKSAEDIKTRVDISDRKFFFGLSSERFISQKHRIGIEIQMNRTEKFMSVTGSTSAQISASSGMILSNFAYIKFGLGGLYSPAYKARLRLRITELDAEAERAEGDEMEQGAILSRRSFTRTKLAAEPKPYFMFGAGAVNTTLFKIKGTMSNGINSTDYSQQKFALETGMGLFTRLGKRLTYDISAKYIWSPAYTPSIGGLNSYSGFRFQVNIGYMSGSSFARMRRVLKSISTNKD
ncbi:hypothetical protein [Chitinophaga tropicalis]|uniref:Outer membrane protein beta-barrel domain-containing protein n=1 Tax=Chitinophaga tropicalis TaxID=2683588 RepID=A0A7K1U7B3_9BACT|nr:hypothetical protein [Chitinophaga tropicalis]MVT10254.1 hypothetical protein [Chitinophaga tropicalis]